MLIGLLVFLIGVLIYYFLCLFSADIMSAHYRLAKAMGENRASEYKFKSFQIAIVIAILIAILVNLLNR